MVWDNGSAGIEGQAMRRYQSLIVNLEISTMARGTVKWFNSQKGMVSFSPQVVEAGMSSCTSLPSSAPD
jgi:hypothetical protein